MRISANVRFILSRVYGTRPTTSVWLTHALALENLEVLKTILPFLYSIFFQAHRKVEGRLSSRNGRKV